jgi:hypothetical protein
MPRARAASTAGGSAGLTVEARGTWSFRCPQITAAWFSFGWHGARQAFEEDACERVDVRLRVDLRPSDLLGCDVVDRPEKRAALSHARACVDLFRQPEVGQVGNRWRAWIRAGLDEDVPGLHVTMDQPAAMSGVERGGDLNADPGNLLGRQGPALPEHGLEVVPVDVAHGDVEVALPFARVQDRDDVGVAYPRRCARLAHEPFPEGLIQREVRIHHLERDRRAEARVLGSIDDPHAATGDQTLDAIAGELRADPRRRSHAGGCITRVVRFMRSGPVILGRDA